MYVMRYSSPMTIPIKYCSKNFKRGTEIIWDSTY